MIYKIIIMLYDFKFKISLNKNNIFFSKERYKYSEIMKKPLFLTYNNV